MPATLGRDDNGNLIFGWCRRCVANHGRARFFGSDGARVEDGYAHLPWRGAPDLVRTAQVRIRHKIVGFLVGMLAAWSGVLFVFGMGLCAFALDSLPRHLMAMSMLGGAALLGAISFALWLVLLDRADRWLATLRVTKVLGAGMALCTLLLGIVEHDPARDPAIVLLVGLGIGASVLAGWAQRHWFGGPPSASKTLVPTEL